MTEKLIIHVDADAARAFKQASPGEQRQLEALLSLRLIEATRTPSSLAETMREIGRAARQRGLTPEILRSLLDDA
jgi:hypothetical protein